MKRSPFLSVIVVAAALLLDARTTTAQLEVTPLLPWIQTPAGSSVLVEAVIENSTDDVLYLNSISADLTDEFAGGDLFDEFNSAAPDSLLPGETWEGPIVRLTLAPGAPISMVHQITVNFTGGIHPYDEQDLAEFTFALNDSAVVAGIAAEVAPVEPGMLRVSPNPTQGSSVVAFELASPQEIEVQVYDIRGVAVRSLAHGLRSAGRHSVVWDGRNNVGGAVAPGIYFVKLHSEYGTRRTKVVRIR